MNDLHLHEERTPLLLRVRGGLNAGFEAEIKSTDIRTGISIL